MIGVVPVLILVGCGLVLVLGVVAAIVIAVCCGGGGSTGGDAFGLSSGEANAVDYLLFFDDETESPQRRGAQRREPHR